MKMAKLTIFDVMGMILGNPIQKTTEVVSSQHSKKFETGCKGQQMQTTPLTM